MYLYAYWGNNSWKNKSLFFFCIFPTTQALSKRKENIYFAWNISFQQLRRHHLDLRMYLCVWKLQFHRNFLFHKETLITFLRFFFFIVVAVDDGSLEQSGKKKREEKNESSHGINLNRMRQYIQRFYSFGIDRKH